MPVKPPPFAVGRRWRARVSAWRRLDRVVWFDPATGYEYEPDPRRNGNWHEIDPRSGEYRDVDQHSGEPVAGSEGRWRRLR